ncbi:MAG: hypothetical protein GTO41_11795 [Burkholderiales bacterium]|nr:hypothetical protein [Burkholderiales bacterium]
MSNLLERIAAHALWLVVILFCLLAALVACDVVLDLVARLRMEVTL